MKTTNCRCPVSRRQDQDHVRLRLHQSDQRSASATEPRLNPILVKEHVTPRRQGFRQVMATGLLTAKSGKPGATVWRHGRGMSVPVSSTSSGPKATHFSDAAQYSGLWVYATLYWGSCQRILMIPTIVGQAQRWHGGPGRTHSDGSEARTGAGSFGWPRFWRGQPEQHLVSVPIWTPNRQKSAMGRP